MSDTTSARIGGRQPSSTIFTALVIASATIFAVAAGQWAGLSLASSTGSAGGAVPDGVTAFDDDVPAVAKLNGALRDAIRLAARDAADDGVEMVINGGWRSPKYQAQLRAEAISKYGSTEKAARWVATADTSAHVSGDAVDIGPARAMTWLSRHGATYGLCQVYRNEPWHYERRPLTTTGRCPSMYPDPSQDPRYGK